jgi:hypothetical protein
MSQANAIGPALNSTDPRAAIARAASATGTDFAFLMAQARIESGLDPAARAASSSAAGLYQFTRQTWLETLDRHGAAHGLDWAGAAISEGRVSDPALRTRLLALRFDPDLSARMAAELAEDNRAALRASLGREPDHAELYLAHFLGTGGASRFLAALATDPGQSAAALLPDAAAANRAVFFEQSGAARSLGQVMDLVRTRMAGAMVAEGASTSYAIAPLEPAPNWATQAAKSGDRNRSPQSIAAGLGVGRTRISMAETLATTFGTAASVRVRQAYSRLKAFGL